MSDEPLEIFDANRGTWAIADPETRAEAEELTVEAYRRTGDAPLHGEPLDVWLDRLERADVILRPEPGWHRDARVVAAVKAAEARGVIVFFPDAPDPLAEKAREFRALPITERFAAYKAQRAALLKET